MSAAAKELDLSEFDVLRRPKGPPCAVGVAIARLSPGESEKVHAAMEHGKTSRSIAERLSEWSGVQVKEHSVARHRRGDCRCE